MNKKAVIIFCLIGILFLGLCIPEFSFAQLKDYSDGSTPDIKNLGEIATRIIGYVFGVIAVICFIVCGILFLTSNGDAQKLEKAKHAFLWGIVGVIVGIIAFSIIKIVNSLLTGGEGGG